ncbi:hypothetical protein [Pseudomonas frederiksbergensis]|uniref:Short-chain dehydrogenase n=1 Tax=Pseudomonas frederiksbergensis TaxID=104087 RepID=A0A423HEN9_9PSED|nr:hypothetical protein [Pseudomonas frederiksbergensis]RON11682.1 hypothetical protein BK662_31050 [Pseudomonas frederiksbergensis]
MNTFQSLTDRYRPLKTSYSDTPVLVVDTEANPHEILDASLQRIRAASDLLETLYCLCFKQADVKDIPNIINALYLLTQDGCELLETAKQLIKSPDKNSNP